MGARYLPITAYQADMVETSAVKMKSNTFAPLVMHLKELQRENRELRQANDILRKASASFAAADLDRLRKK